PIALIGGGDDPVTLEVEAGKVVRVEGGRRARRLQQILEEVPGADHLSSRSWRRCPAPTTSPRLAWGSIPTPSGTTTSRRRRRRRATSTLRWAATSSTVATMRVLSIWTW